MERSKWAAPVVPVVTRYGKVRVCGDFKVTINPVLEMDPLPKTEDIFANLSPRRKFSKIDRSEAYLQMEVSDDSKELLTINTHKGLFQYNRLVYGVTSAPSGREPRTRDFREFPTSSVTWTISSLPDARTRNI